MPRNATPRSLPVIVITGTPGTGKTTHAQLVVAQSPVPLQHVNVSELVKEKMLHDGFDDEWQTYVVDEDKVCVLASSRPPWLLRTRVLTYEHAGGRRIGTTNRGRWRAHSRLAYV